MGSVDVTGCSETKASVRDASRASAWAVNESFFRFRLAARCSLRFRHRLLASSVRRLPNREALMFKSIQERGPVISQDLPPLSPIPSPYTC